jgi:integrase
VRSGYLDRQLIEAAKRERNGVRWVLALVLGLRQGEALGLKWDDVDWTTGLLSVMRSRTRPRMSTAASQTVGTNTRATAQRGRTRARRQTQRSLAPVSGSFPCPARSSSYCWLLLGVHERTIMSVLGWSTIAMASRYTHVITPIHNDLASRLDGLLWSSKDAPNGPIETTFETTAKTPAPMFRWRSRLAWSGWRWRRDLNPRRVAPHALSRRAL